MILQFLTDLWTFIVHYVGEATIVLQLIIGILVGTILGLLHRTTTKVSKFAVENKPQIALVFITIIGLLLIAFYQSIASPLHLDPITVVVVAVFLMMLGLSKAIFRGVGFVRGLKEA